MRGAVTVDGVTLPSCQGALWDVARAVHEGTTWAELAAALGAPRVRGVRDHYRPRIRSRIVRLLGPPAAGEAAHGTLPRFWVGGCYENGRRCDACLAAHADYGARWRRSRGLAVRTNPAFLERLAGRLHAGETWDEIASSWGRTRSAVQAATREAVQPYALALVERDLALLPQRPHGTRAAYVVDRCRCEPCTYANWRYERGRSRKARRGLVPYVDAGPVREHLAWLAERGVGLKTVAKVSGVPDGALSKVVYGGAQGRPPSRRARAATRDKVLAVHLGHALPGCRVDAAPTWARIAWLLEAGATKCWIAQQLGQKGPGLQLSRSSVTVRNARAVEQLAAAVGRGEIATPRAPRRSARAA